MKANRNLNILTMTEVSAVSGESGNYSVTLKTRPRYINENCTACGECEKVVEAEFDNEYDYGMKKPKGTYLPFNMSYPQRYVLDPNIIGTPDADKAKAACKYDAIDLDMQESETTLTVGAIIWATGWQPYDADKIQPYGHDRFDNVVSSVEFERMLDPFGPTGGKIVTPCPVCQMNVEVYQDHINQKYKTNFKIPVVYYSTLMSVAYGSSGKEAGLDGQIIKAKQLEEIASK